MLNKLQVLEDKYKELTEKISDIEVINDQKTWQKYMKEHADLEPIVMKYREYKEVVDNIKESKEILEEESDEELRELAKMELSDLESRVEPIEDELKILLLPKDPNDEKNVIVEIRGGAGGDEAALFAGDLFRMYSRYAERRRWKTELLPVRPESAWWFRTRWIRPWWWPLPTVWPTPCIRRSSREPIS